MWFSCKKLDVHLYQKCIFSWRRPAGHLQDGREAHELERVPGRGRVEDHAVVAPGLDEVDDLGRKSKRTTENRTLLPYPHDRVTDKKPRPPIKF